MDFTSLPSFAHSGTLNDWKLRPGPLHDDMDIPPRFEHTTLDAKNCELHGISLRGSGRLNMIKADPFHVNQQTVLLLVSR